MEYYFLPGMQLKTSAIGVIRYKIILHISHTGMSCYNYDFVVKFDFKKSLYMLRNGVHKLQPVLFGMTQFLLSVFNDSSARL